MGTLRSINPANNALVGEVALTSSQEITEKVNGAHAVKKEWKMLGAKSRAEMLRPLFVDVNTCMGPLAAERQLHLLESQITDAVTLGAKVLYGGEKPVGLFYPL